MSLPFAREPSMPMHVVQRLLEVFERMGVARAVLSHALGGRAEASDDPDARVPASKIACLWRLALEHTKDPAFGLHWVDALNQRTFAPFSYMLQEAGSLRSAFELLLHFERLLTDMAFFALLDDGDAVTVRIAPLGDPTSREARFMAEIVAAGLLRMAREVNARVALRYVRFAYPAPAHRGEYERFFTRAVAFDQPFSELVFERALFDAPLPQADREVHIALKTVAEQRMQRVTRATSYAARLRELFHQRIPEHVGMSAAARALGLSTRSLRRQLTVEGTSYREVEYAAFESAAKRLLRDERRTIQETAYELGFADATTFHRAFKRWTGMTPSEFRDKR